MPKLPYDPITDLVPVIDLVKSPLWLAVSTRNTTATNIQDFIADVHANPTKHAFGSLGNGSTSHILGERINEITKSRMLHVPYKGSAAVTLALMNGEISLAILDLVTLQPQLQSGKIRLIGVTGDVRSPLTPEVATLKEQGLNGFENLTWAGLFYPAKTPDKTIERLHDAALKVLGDPAIQDRLKGLGYLPGGNSQKSFAESVAKERAYWKEMIAKTHVTAN